MTDIPLPQSGDPGTFIYAINEGGTFAFARINITDVNFSGFYGPPLFSGTLNTVGVGLMSWVVPEIGNFAVDDWVLSSANGDPTNIWVYGVVYKIDLTGPSPVLYAFITKQSGLVASPADWSLQKWPDFGSSSSALIGFSGDVIAAAPTLGSTVTLNCDTGKLFNKSTVLVSNLIDPSKYFRGCAAYDGVAGTVAIFVLDVSAAFPAGAAGWKIVAQDGPGVDSNRRAYSNTNNPITSGLLTFTIQAGKFLPTNGSVIISALPLEVNLMLAKIISYVGTTLTVAVPANGVFGSGSSISWSIQLIDAPPVYGTPKPSSVTQVSSASSTNSSTIALPAGIQAGDIIVLLDICGGGVGTPVAVVPTGFTQAKQDFIAFTTSRSILSYKLATAADASAVVTGMVPPAQSIKLAAVFRCDVPATILSVGSPVSATATVAANPANQIVTAGGGTAPLIVLGAFYTDDSGGAFTHSMTPAATSEITANTAALKAYLDWKLYNAAPANNTISQAGGSGTSGGQIMQGCYIAATSLGYSVGDIVTLIDVGGGVPGLPGVDGSKLTNLPIPTPPVPVTVNYSATVTATNLTNTISAVDTAADTVTSIAHGRTTGESVLLSGSQPAGLLTGAGYYVRADTVDKLGFFLKQSDAVNNINRVNITGATTGGTIRRLAITNVPSGQPVGLMAAGGVGIIPATTVIGIEFNLAVALATLAVSGKLTLSGLFVGAVLADVGIGWNPTVTASTVSYPGATKLIGDVAGSWGQYGTWAQVGTTAWNFDLQLWGA